MIDAVDLVAHHGDRATLVVDGNELTPAEPNFFYLLVHHELNSSQGVTRDHGNAGAFISNFLGRDNGSNTARAMLAHREQKRKAEEADRQRKAEEADDLEYLRSLKRELRSDQQQQPQRTMSA